MPRRKSQNAPDSHEQQIRIPIHLEDDRVVSALGRNGLSLSFCDIAFIRLCTANSARLCLELEAIDGRKIAVRWRAGNPGASSYFTLAVELMTRASRQNEFVTFAIGPSRRIWIAAWIGLITSIVVIIGMTWAVLTGLGIPTALLPMALAPVSLIAVLPILLNGPSQRVGLQQVVKSLAERQPASAAV